MHIYFFTDFVSIPISGTLYSVVVDWITVHIFTIVYECFYIARFGLVFAEGY